LYEQTEDLKNTSLLEERESASVKLQKVFVHVGQDLARMMAVLGGKKVIDTCEEWQTLADPRIGVQ
jgi:hypothetical protein